MYVCIYMYNVCLYVSVGYACVHACTYVHVYRHASMHVYVYARTHTYIPF